MKSPSKTASSQVSWALLTEGVTRARVDVHRLRLLLNRALTMVELSDAKDHLWQVAGDIIQGVPDRIQDVETALDRTSYALALMGEDFLRGRLPLDDRYLVDEGARSNPTSGPMEKDSMSTRVAGRYLQAMGVAPSAEGHFFDRPDKREVREFAQSGAISNEPSAAAIAIRHMETADVTVSEAVRESKDGPPTVDDILEDPGADTFSTLTRFLIQTEQPGVMGVPKCRDDINKHPKLPTQRTRP